MAEIAPPTERYSTSLLPGAVVTIAGYFYHVEFIHPVGDKSGNGSTDHLVSKDRRCACPMGAGCPAVAVVADYLKAGGERAPDPPPGFYPVAPATCPVCGAEAVYEPRLSSSRRGAGWRCMQGGSLHYWEAHVQVLKRKAAANPWLFPPVVIRAGVRMLSYDGILDGDRVLYAGVLR